ncbi:microcin ABC transporter permease, partial [Vibrio echinoideorum]
AYIFGRLLLVIPTLWASITINFIIIQIAPGGPVEQAVALLEGHNSGIMARFSGGGQEVDVSECDHASAGGYKGS